MKTTTRSFRGILVCGFSFVLASAFIACGDNVDVDPAPQYVNLFACGVDLSCPMYCSHLGIEPCTGSGTVQCAGDLWLSGTNGAVMLQDRPGPGTWQGDVITLLLGDGKALVQERTRSCADGAACDVQTAPWNLEEQKLCDVKTPPSNCTQSDCMFLPMVENCVPVEKEWTCAEAKSVVSAAP